MEDIDQIAIFAHIVTAIGFCTGVRLPIELADVLKRFREESRIIVRRLFGDISNAMRTTKRNMVTGLLRRMPSGNLFLHEDIPCLAVRRNTADTRLAAEAVVYRFCLAEHY